MRKRIYIATVMILAASSVAVATLMGQRSARRAGATQRASAAAQTRRANQPIRPADPNLAPRPMVDDALYASQEFFGEQSSVARPYSEALDRVNTLAARYPKDSVLPLHAARLSEKLGRFDKAADEMNRYAELKHRSADALRRLVSFYENRARYVDEVKTLRELARAMPVDERSATYKRAADLVRSRSLTEFNPADFFAELVAADESNPQPVKDYVTELRLAKKPREAIAVLDKYQPKFPAELPYFLKSRASILERTAGRQAAEDAYSAVFEPAWPRQAITDYLELLRRFGRYRVVRRALQEQFRKGASDLAAVGRLFSFYCYEKNFTAATRILTTLEERRAGGAGTASTVGGTNWPPHDLEVVTNLYASIGNYDQAARYLYTLYLAGALQAGTEAREEALFRLFKAVLDAGDTPTRFGAGDLSFYKDIAEVDQHSGFLNGVLSLVLSDTQPAYKYDSQDKAAAGYFNRAFAYRIFMAFKSEYSNSKWLEEMYLGALNVYSAIGEYKRMIEVGREFQARYPNSRFYKDISLRIADAYVALKDRAGERTVLAALLDRLAKNKPAGATLLMSSKEQWRYGSTPVIDKLIDKIRYNIEAYSDTYNATEKSDSSSEEESNSEEEPNQEEESTDSSQAPAATDYSNALERYVGSLAAEDKKTETAAFFWGEIKKHPKEQGLYERFLNWLGQAQLVNEELKAYNSAIRQFDSNTWYHRLARWYVREKRGRELNRYSRQLISIFNEEEITDYLVRFAGYGTEPEGDKLDWDEKFAFDLYSFAHNRFPRNLFFVRGMLTYLEKTDRARWEKLSAQYYFADRSVREPYLAWLFSKQQLRARYDKARASIGASEFSAYKVFAADAAMWLSHHDEALDAYRTLAKLYPGEAQYAGRLADLTRSFGYDSSKYYEESAAVLSSIADVYPSNHEYRIKAGEVYAQLGDYEKAGREWDKLVKQEPGERNTYLEIATVYWDYFQYDAAIRVFNDLRNVTGDPTIYAYRLGAVYEGKGDMDSAIAEYVKVLSEPGDGRSTVVTRLAQLAPRRGMSDRITAQFNSARASKPNDWQLIIGYAEYLTKSDRLPDALALLREQINKSSDLAFLETIREMFHTSLRTGDEQFAIERLASLARDERESMMYRLQLASFLERHNQSDSSIAIIDKLDAEYPTNAGVIEESEKFYWRAGLLDRALDLYKKSIDKARGASRRSLTLRLARRQMEAGRLPEAEATLRTQYETDHSDTETFGELVSALGAEGKLAELTELYRSALQEARTVQLTDEMRSRIADLRSGMIRPLDKLGRYQEALDQHIEIVNLFPEDTERLGAAYEYAQNHDLAARLTSYYEKLAKDSYKNYRWQLVLGRLKERLGDLESASEQYRIALVNEPQRSDLRLLLASALARPTRGTPRYDEAIAVLREGWNLFGKEPSWLIEIARIQIRQGKRADVSQTMRQALASTKNPTAQSVLLIASQLEAWGIHDEAARVFEQGFAVGIKNLKDEYIAPDLNGYVRVLVRTQEPAAALSRVDRLREQLDAIARNSKDSDSYRARSLVTSIDATMRAQFGVEVVEYATAQQAVALAVALRSATAPFTTYNDRETLARYQSIARACLLVEVEEEIQTRIKDAAFQARTNADDTRCYNELRSLIAFYDRHAAFVKAAEVLTAQQSKDQYKNRFDYGSEIAARYRLSGDTDRELEWLRRVYAGASGELTANNNPAIDRYLSLLISTGKRDELEQLAAKFSPYELQLINFLIEKNESHLARIAIAHAKLRPAWVSSRSAEVGLALKETGPEIEDFFKSALNIAPIGQQVGRRVDTSQTLVGQYWFLSARNYGYWLSMAGRADSRKYAVGEIEGKPSSTRAQLELAAFYLDRKDPNRAADHVALADELSPGVRNVLVMRGAVELARKNRSGALEAWDSIISRRASAADAQLYLRVMSENGLLREALPKLENFIVSFVGRETSRNSNSRAETVKPLVEQIAERAASSKLTSQAAEALYATITALPSDTVIGRTIIEEQLLPDAHLASIYRVIHTRMSDLAAALVGTPEYDGGLQVEGQYIIPSQALAELRRQYLDYLIRNNSLNEARLLIDSIKREQANLMLPTQAGSANEPDVYEHYEWLPLASALIELRSGPSNAAKALAILKRYCGLELTGPQPSGVTRDRDHCLRAYALLMAEHKEADADALLYDAYRADVSGRGSQGMEAALAGLAEIEARRGRLQEAGRWLKQLAERSVDNSRLLQLAAETAARIGLFEDAITYRSQLATVLPQDAANRLELARTIAAAGRRAEAVNQLAALASDDSSPNTVRAQSAEAVNRILQTNRGDQGLRSAAVEIQRGAQSKTGNSAAQLIAAAIAEGLGNFEEAKRFLATIEEGSLAAAAHLKLGIIERATGNSREAIRQFERALYIDADGEVTNSIALAAADPMSSTQQGPASPRAALVVLYANAGLDSAAINLVSPEQSREGGVPQIALISLLTAAKGERQIAFEPSLAVQRRSSRPALATIDQLNQAALANTDRLREAVVASYLRLGMYERAREVQRTSLFGSLTAEQKTAIEKKLTEITTAEAAERLRKANLFHVSRSNATDSIYAAKFLVDREEN